MSTITKTLVTLEIEYDSETCDPHTWDWATLLDAEYVGYLNGVSGGTHLLRYASVWADTNEGNRP